MNLKTKICEPQECTRCQIAKQDFLLRRLIFSNILFRLTVETEWLDGNRTLTMGVYKFHSKLISKQVSSVLVHGSWTVKSQVPLSTLKICQLFCWPVLRAGSWIRIHNVPKRRNQIWTRSFQIHNTVDNLLPPVHGLNRLHGRIYSPVHGPWTTYFGVSSPPPLRPCMVPGQPNLACLLPPVHGPWTTYLGVSPPPSPWSLDTSTLACLLPPFHGPWTTYIGVSPPSCPWSLDNLPWRVSSPPPSPWSLDTPTLACLLPPVHGPWTFTSWYEGSAGRPHLLPAHHPHCNQGWVIVA
jgi:hypothetical protein